MRNKILWLLVSCLMVAALLLASCGPAVEEEAPTKPAPTKPAPTKPEPTKPAEEEEEEVAPTIKEPQYGGTLRVMTHAAQYEPMSWDIADCVWSTNMYTSPYLENLLVGDIDKGIRGSKEFSFTAYEWVPEASYTGSLAKSYELLADPLRLVFHLREGVMWQGKPGVMAAREFTADDVVFALHRYDVSPKSSPARLDWVKSITAKDEYTVVLELNRFHANWGYLIAWGWATKIYPPELVDAGMGDWENAVGTGPFMMTDYVSGTSVTYDRSSSYWGIGTIDGKEYQLPLVDRMVYYIASDESTRIAALRTGKVDMEETVSWKFKKTIEERNPELRRWGILGSGVFLIGMRNDKEPFDDVRVRRAMNMAIDRQALVDSVFGGNGVIQNYPLYANYPETIYTPLEKLPDSVKELYTYNPEKAKQLLAEAGYPDGFKTELIIDTQTTHVDQASMIVSCLADIGVEVELKSIEYGTLHGIMHSKAHEQMLAIQRGSTNPFNVLRATLLCEQWWNPAMFCDQKYEAMYWTAAENTDATERAKAVKEMTLYAMSQAPYIACPGESSYRYAWPWVKNYYGESDFGYFNAVPGHARIWLDQNLKKEMGY